MNPALSVNAQPVVPPPRPHDAYSGLLRSAVLLVGPDPTHVLQAASHNLQGSTILSIWAADGAEFVSC